MWVSEVRPTLIYSESFNRGLLQTMVYTNISTLNNPVAAVTEQFQRLTADEQLALLWFAYTELGKSLTPAAPGAARLQFAQGLIEQFKQMSYPEQMEAMRDLINKKNTPVCRAYGVLTKNTKLAFWYVLGELMDTKEVIPVPEYYRMSPAAVRVFGSLSKLEFNQQITVMRNMVVNMGFDPLA
jgi:hypothetical protein